MVIHSMQSHSGADKSAARMSIAIFMSVAFHIALLMLQFGEYGEGLPVFELPSGDRRAQTPEIHLNLGNAISNASVPPIVPAVPVVPGGIDLPALQNQAFVLPRPTVKTSVVKEFDVIPIVVPASPPSPVPDLKAIAAKPRNRSSTTNPRLIVTDTNTADFKVPQSEQVDVIPAMNDEVQEITPTAIVPEMDSAKTVPIETPQVNVGEKEATLQAEKQKQEELRQEELRQEELRQEELRQEELRQQKLKHEELSRQQAVEQAEREKAQQAILAARTALEFEQRKLAEAVREDQVKKELAKKEQLEREKAEHEKLEREIAAKKRIEAEELNRRQQQEKLLAEQKAAEQAAKLAEQSRLSAEAQAQARVTANTTQTKQSENDLNDLLGASTDRASGRTAGSNSAAGSQDLDKLLAGRTVDFDKNGDVVKSSAGTTLPTPKFESSPSARRSIFGSKNGDVDLNLYIKIWRQKIESNGRLNYSQSSKDHMHTDPLVTVSIKSDGTVENIIILRSSGRRDIDEAVRRIVIVNAPYAAFPPSMARRFDVVDIRQIWVFDETLQVTDEMR